LFNFFLKILKTKINILHEFMAIVTTDSHLQVQKNSTITLYSKIDFYDIWLLQRLKVWYAISIVEQ
jgi:hypothetical protein